MGKVWWGLDTEFVWKYLLISVSNCRSKESHSSQTTIMTWPKLSWVGLKDGELRHLTLTAAFVQQFYKIWVIGILWIRAIKLSKAPCDFHKKIYILQSEDNYEKQKRSLKNCCRQRRMRDRRSAPQISGCTSLETTATTETSLIPHNTNLWILPMLLDCEWGWFSWET